MTVSSIHSNNKGDVSPLCSRCLDTSQGRCRASYLLSSASCSSIVKMYGLAGISAAFKTSLDPTSILAPSEMLTLLTVLLFATKQAGMTR